MIRIFALPFFTLLIAVITADNSEVSKHQNNFTYPEHLTGAFTGGFGEETCRSCHFDYDLNPDGGGLTISGISENISAGEAIEIEIEVEREKLGAAGFQLSARYENGSQAGRFNVGENDRIMFSESVPDSLQYVQHTNEGTNPSGENKNSWTITWKAPKTLKGMVIFNITANAANGDQSEFGDYIYAGELEVGM